MSIVDDLLKKVRAEEDERNARSFDELTSDQDQLTFGPLANNLSGAYAAGGRKWDMFFCDKLSPDIVLIFLSRMAQMYLHTGDLNFTGPIPKKVKDLLVRDYYFVHTSE